jgi:hypothetical protein
MTKVIAFFHQTIQLGSKKKHAHLYYFQSIEALDRYSAYQYWNNLRVVRRSQVLPGCKSR